MIHCDRLIFGGSFDPPHRGHLAILRYALAENLAPEIDLVPAAVSPFKIDAPPTAGDHRRRLLEAALADLADGADLQMGSDAAAAVNAAAGAKTGDSFTPANAQSTIDVDRIHLHTLELERPPPSYSADTCATLRRAHPDARIGLLLGSDSLHDFERWNRAAEILAYHPVFVFQRAGDSPATIAERIRELSRLLKSSDESRPPVFVPLSNPLFPCASSDLRSADAANEREACLTPRVARLVRDLRLY